MAELDWGQAFQSVLKKAGVPTLPGVSHFRKVFTPVAVLKKKDLSPAVCKMLRAESKTKEPSVQEQATQFKLVAGNNSAESLAGAARNQLRRLGSQGRTVCKTPESKNLQGLCAARLLRSPGFESVLQSLSLFRKAGQDGLLGSPATCWDAAGTAQWLYDDLSQPSESFQNGFRHSYATF